MGNFEVTFAMEKYAEPTYRLIILVRLDLSLNLHERLKKTHCPLSVYFHENLGPTISHNTLGHHGLIE
jgi:hypothetical protein